MKFGQKVRRFFSYNRNKPFYWRLGTWAELTRWGPADLINRAHCEINPRASAKRRFFGAHLEATERLAEFHRERGNHFAKRALKREVKRGNQTALVERNHYLAAFEFYQAAKRYGLAYFYVTGGLNEEGVAHQLYAEELWGSAREELEAGDRIFSRVTENVCLTTFGSVFVARWAGGRIGNKENEILGKTPYRHYDSPEDLYREVMWVYRGLLPGEY